jgi:YjjG family noncanonical pyrimidine nucleotidase
LSLNYDVVLLDADDTIFDFYRAETYALEASLAAFGYDAPVDGYLEAFRRINGEVWKEYETGRSTSEEIRVKRFVLLLSELGLAYDAAEVSAYYVDRLGETTFMVDGARKLLDALHRKLPMALVTNGISAVQRSRLAKSGVGDYFGAIMISDELGVQKPDPGIFLRALEHVGTTPGDRVIMIGDSLHSDIRGAIAAGIDSCWFNLRGRPSEPEIVPTHTISRLDEIYAILGLA